MQSRKFKEVVGSDVAILYSEKENANVYNKATIDSIKYDKDACSTADIHSGCETQILLEVAKGLAAAADNVERELVNSKLQEHLSLSV